jgi:hypothetical protein
MIEKSCRKIEGFQIAVERLSRQPGGSISESNQKGIVRSAAKQGEKGVLHVRLLFIPAETVQTRTFTEGLTVSSSDQ